MLGGQITRDHPLYSVISSYYRSSYDEAKDYTVPEFHLVCSHFSKAMENYYNETLRVPLSTLSYNSLYNALLDTFKSDQEDRAHLIKAIIGSFMNFAFIMNNAATIWRQKNVPEETFLVLVSLFQWMTFEQGQAEIKRWLPIWKPPVVLFRAATRMSTADPFINMANIDYSSTVVNAFYLENTNAAKQEKLRQTGGQMLNYDTYSVRTFGPESDLADFSFLLKAQEAGAERVLSPYHGGLKTVELTDLYKSATKGNVRIRQYASWDFVPK